MSVLLDRGIIEETRADGLRVRLRDGRVGVVPTLDLYGLDPYLLNALQEGGDLPVVVHPNQCHTDGVLLLSLFDALQHQDWQALEHALRHDETVQVTVIGHNAGGLIVYFRRVQGFVPFSEIEGAEFGLATETRTAVMMALREKILSVTCLAVAARTKTLILSERIASDRRQRAHRLELAHFLVVGTVLQTTVLRCTNKRVYLDYRGVKLRMPIYELSWASAHDPKPSIYPGQTLAVKVTCIDRERATISLSHRRLEADPWDHVPTRYFIGQQVATTVTGVVNFGLLLEIETGVRGVAHASVLNRYPEWPATPIGSVWTAQIVSIDVASRRIRFAPLDDDRA